MQELVWGAANLTANSTTFLYPGYYRSPSASASPVQIRVPWAATAIGLYAVFGVAGVTTGNLVFTLGLNGVDTSLALTIGNTSTSGNTSGTLSIAQADLARMKLVVPAGVTPPQRVFIVTFLL